MRDELLGSKKDQTHVGETMSQQSNVCPSPGPFRGLAVLLWIFFFPSLGFLVTQAKFISPVIFVLLAQQVLAVSHLTQYMAARYFR